MERKFLKCGILSLVLVLIWTGCTEELGGQPELVDRVLKETNEALELLLLSTARSYSLEGIRTVSDPHYLDDVTVYLRYATEEYFTYAWTSAEIAARGKANSCHWNPIVNVCYSKW